MERLPIELVSQIGLYLTHRDFLSLSMSCRRIRDELGLLPSILRYGYLKFQEKDYDWEEYNDWQRHLGPLCLRPCLHLIISLKLDYCHGEQKLDVVRQALVLTLPNELQPLVQAQRLVRDLLILP